MKNVEHNLQELSIQCTYPLLEKRNGTSEVEHGSRVHLSQYLRNRKHVLSVSIELQKREWKFRRTRNAVG